ncbi:hypothetical protein [Kitasatospora purpeofusca]|uniref:hypothetical protein n=1 Tax=Kitasatospora purpeofusca TaxID=67352 RepID=UPI002A5ABF8F|nr:hypothetical protein [Kitasatospora purpeofusca]MDY0811000.1 hypothetical protein [Kitasatospora purpeofusca]
MVREAAQNSWDARCDDQAIVRFRLDLSSVGAAHIGEWRRLFANGLPQAGDADGAFRSLAQSSSIRYLAVSDRGTNGLGGPTRSDAGHSTRREWLRFVLNSGDRDGDQQHGSTGGTFGYGKGAFFLTSKVGCTFVYTRFRDDDGTLRSRFIGSAIRRSFWHEGLRYTGRHWWGTPDAEHCEPLHDAVADDVARRMGLPAFGGEDTGTTVVIVEPDLTDPTLPDTDAAEEMNTNDAGTYLADAAAWNLWPIMLEERPSRMAVSVTANGVQIGVPTPADDAALAFFADAYRKVAGGQGEILNCLKPKKELGDFAYEYTYGATVTSPAARDLGVEGAPHHICLIRGPELVTRYHSGPERPNPQVGYAGVFKVTDELDPVFARSEPPTHDAWAYQQLKGHESTFVRTLGRRLKERCDVISGATNKKAFKVDDFAVGSVAQRLGHLLAGPGGTGAAVVDVAPRPGTSFTPGHTPAEEAVSGEHHETSDSDEARWHGSQTGAGGDHFGDLKAPKSGSGGRTTATRRPTLVSHPSYEILAGRPVLVQQVRIHGSGRNEGHVKVVTGEGATEGVSPVGVIEPTIHGWRIAGGEIVPGEVLYHSDGLVEVELIVNAVPDAVLEINVTGQV